VGAYQIGRVRVDLCGHAHGVMPTKVGIHVFLADAVAKDMDGGPSPAMTMRRQRPNAIALPALSPSKAQ
jgi:hypothetical protein